MDTNKLLDERKKTHGEYSEHARCTQSIMRVLMQERNWDSLSDIQRESLHMFAHKMGRVVTGNPDIHDHWDDIAGYAKLVSDRIPKAPAPSHLSPAQETMRRDMAGRTEHPAPFGYSAADEGEPNRPGTPEDGGHHALQQEDEDELNTSPRQPRDATWKEWDGFRNMTIPSGTMKNERWGDIYSKGHEGRYLMAPEHVEEYGR